MGLTGGIWRAFTVSVLGGTLGDLGCEVHPKSGAVVSEELELLVPSARPFTISSVPCLEGSWPVSASHSGSPPRILLIVGALTL